MNRDSNVYTFTFAALMVFVVASVLAFTSFSLKDLQNENVRKEKMQKSKLPQEFDGRNGPEPTRYNDWEKNGITSDF